MRWMLTEDEPGLAALLAAHGQEVVSDPSCWVSTFLPDYETAGDYPLEHLGRDRGANVAVLIDPVRYTTTPEGKQVQFGFSRMHVQHLRERHRCSLVMFARDDPATWQAYKERRVLQCSCRPNDVAVWMTPSMMVRDIVEKTKRAVLWEGDEASVRRLIAAVEHAKGGRSYIPVKDARLFR